MSEPADVSDKSETADTASIIQRRRRLVLLGLAGLLLLPQLIFLGEVKGLGLYLGSQPPPGQGTYIMMRAAGHLAFVLVFLQVLLGARGFAIARYLGERSLLSLHRALGVTTLSMAFLHPIFFLWARTLRTGSLDIAKTFLPSPTDYYHNRLLLGALMLYGLVGTAVYGLLGPRRAPRVWRAIHRFNYLIFFGLWYHAISIGSETRHPVLVLLYGAMVLTVGWLAALGLRKEMLLIGRRRAMKVRPSE
jgi:predicted ferric reductase